MVSEFGTEDDVCDLLFSGIIWNEVAPTVAEECCVNRDSGQRTVEVFVVVVVMSRGPV